MINIDFSKIEDHEEFTPLPEGTYRCRLDNVEEASTKNGDEMWRLRFSVVEGDHTGRRIFDNMVFSDAAVKRAKLICSHLGVDVSGEVALTPDMIIGRECEISVQVEEYQDVEGKVKSRNVVPYAGYDAVDTTDSAPSPRPAAEADSIDDDDVPF